MGASPLRGPGTVAPVASRYLHFYSFREQPRNHGGTGLSRENTVSILNHFDFLELILMTTDLLVLVG